MALEGEVGANDGFSGPRKRELYVRGRSLRCKTEHQKADVQSPHGRFSPAPKTRHTISIPKTPTGAERPADVIGNAVHVMRIATGQIDESEESAHARAGRLGGGKGGTVDDEAECAEERPARDLRVGRVADVRHAPQRLILYFGQSQKPKARPVSKIKRNDAR